MASSTIWNSENISQFLSTIEEWRSNQLSDKGFSVSELDGKPKDVVVAFRTRPPLPNEGKEVFVFSLTEDEDGGVARQTIEFCPGISVISAEPGEFCAHVPAMKWNGMSVSHKKYNADLAFGPAIDNEEVYQRLLVANEVIDLVLSGGIACVLAYGQTGSGKTFTMEGLESRVARDLFKAAEIYGEKLLAKECTQEDSSLTPQNVYEFSVTFLELLGKRATDLISPGADDDTDTYNKPEVAIQEDKNGKINPRLTSVPVSSSEELRELLTKALSHRRTRSTLRNATSSRSHAFLKINIKNRLLPYAEDGQFILVDLAGSERYEDSKAHDKKRMDESRENNKSLMNLKDCVRAKAKFAEEDGFVHVPWRSNKLTMLLKPIFDIESRQPNRTIVIAHVSPHIQDVVHSTNTLSYAAPFKTNPVRPRGPVPYDMNDPRTWDHKATYEWLKNKFTKASQVSREAAVRSDAKRANLVGSRVISNVDLSAPLDLLVDIDKLCPPGLTGRNLGELYTREFVERCLEARPPASDGKPHSKHSTDTLKTRAVTIIGELFYLTLTAKSQKRNAIMKSRKHLELDETYGVAPERW